MVRISTQEPPPTRYNRLNCRKVVLCYAWNSCYGPDQINCDPYVLSFAAVLPIGYALTYIDQCYALCPKWTFLVIFFHLVLVCKTHFLCF